MTKARLEAFSGGVGLAFVRPWIAQTLAAVVAAMWLVPDRRIEAALAEPAAR